MNTPNSVDQNIICIMIKIKFLKTVPLKTVTNLSKFLTIKGIIPEPFGVDRGAREKT